MSVLQNKKILLGVSSSIAIYKSLELIRLLRKSGAEVKVVMTQWSTRLISPLTFETLSQNPVCVELFTRQTQWEIEHISLARWADLMVIAPATANVIGKLANGIADDALTTIYLAFRGPVYVAPAMNSAMYEKPQVQQNLQRLQAQGVKIIEPEEGELACGEEGKGRLVEPTKMLALIETEFATRNLLSGIKFLITAGPTREFIDSVRFISNPSSGKMGMAIAEEAARRGAQVTLIMGPTALPLPVDKNIITTPVVSAEEMYQAVLKHIKDVDVAVFAAAVADYRPEKKLSGKVKKAKETMELKLERTPDIAAQCGKYKSAKQIFIGFAAEAGENIDEAKRKLGEKNFDLVLLNDITQSHYGFGSDKNKVVVIGKDNSVEQWGLMSKKDIAIKLLEKIKSLRATGE